MRLPSGFTDDVKNQADIVRVVSDYVTLKKRGANYIARCPFHSEKTPSFNVHQGKGIYKCFGCGVGGSVFDFIMQIEGCSFPEAVRIVAQKSGIPIPSVEDTEDHKKVARDREVVLRLNQWAAEFFAGELRAGKECERAREYVRGRGISEETTAQFLLGYAPDRWDGLINHLKDRNATPEEIEMSGLVVIKEQGTPYDRFRGRLMFPITDSQSRVIAFGGRIIGEGEPKYLNSPETPVYIKGRNLYGLAEAKNEIRKVGYAILVEGYLDCIIPVQEGIQNVVATLGTALTDGQVRLLRRYMEQPQVVVNFDPDSAGQSATMRSIELFIGEGFKVNVLRLPTKEDPDEFVRSHGADEFKQLLRSTQPYIEYVVETAVSAHDVSRPSGKVEAINAILPHLVRMPDKAVRAGYAEQIADRLKVDNRIVREEVKRAATNRYSALDSKKLRRASTITDAERQLLELLLNRPDVRTSIVSNLHEEDYDQLATAALFSIILEAERIGGQLDYEALSENIEGETERNLLPGLLMSDLAWAGGDDYDTLFKKATEAIRSLKRKRIEKNLDVIQMKIGEAERNNDGALCITLYQEKAELKKRMLELSR
jgi:DNA primase